MIEVSVIIPCYNVDLDILKRCLDSVLNQTFENYEIILVDDGSTPMYKAFLLEIKKWDHRIKVLSQVNRGVSAARNKGVQEAKGEYVTFLDADDAFLPEFLSEAYALCKEKKIDFLIGGNVSQLGELWKQRNVDEPIILEKIGSKNKSRLIKDLVGDLHKFGELGGYIGRGPVSRFIKREIAVKIMFDELLIMEEDIEWNMRMLNESSKVYVAYRIWYLYYANSNSTTHRYNSAIISLLEQGLLKLEKELDFHDSTQCVGYCQHLLDDLRKIYFCYVGHKDCNLDKNEKSKIISYLYKAEPWIKIKRFNVLKGLDIKTAIKCFLYNIHSYFLILKAQNIFKGKA